MQLQDHQGTPFIDNSISIREFLAHANSGTARELRSLESFITIRPDESVIRAGSRPTHIYFHLAGRALRHSFPPIPSTSVREGRIYGIQEALSDNVFNILLVAVTTCTFARIATDDFLGFLGHNAVVCNDLVFLLARTYRHSLLTLTGH